MRHGGRLSKEPLSKTFLKLWYDVGTVSSNVFFGFFFSSSMARSCATLLISCVMTVKIRSSSLSMTGILCPQDEGHLSNSNFPLVQSMVGLCCLSHFSPIMRVFFPNPHTAKEARSLCPLTSNWKSIISLIILVLFRVPSTLKTGISCARRHVLRLFSWTNVLST